MPKRKHPEAEEPPHNGNHADEKHSSQDSTNKFEIAIEGKKPIQCERHGSTASKPDLIFTHGAGGGLTAPALQDFAAGFAKTSNMVMFKGNMNLKSRISSFQRVMEHEDCHPALGGRSMGARAACLAAQHSQGNITALVLVSFPLVGAQKGDSREKVLLDLPADVDVLFVSGTEDSMCELDDLRAVAGRMQARSWIVEIEGADHGMAIVPQAGSQPVRARTGEIAAEWLRGRDEGKRSFLLGWDEEEGVVVSEGWFDADADATEAESSEVADKEEDAG